jgi:LPS sulfotransferase NodH
LAESLEQTGLAGRPREYFEAERQEEFKKAWGLPNESSYPTFFAKVVETGTLRNGIFGAKVHWSQFQDFVPLARQLPGCANLEVQRLLSSVFPNLHYIWLTRRDKVRQAISYYRAIRTSIWWHLESGDHQTTVDVNNDVAFDPAAIDNLLGTIIAHESAWKRYFSECGAAPLVLEYEDVAEHLYENIIRVLQYLNVPVSPYMEHPQPRVMRQADKVTDKWVTQYYNFKGIRM